MERGKGGVYGVESLSKSGFFSDLFFLICDSCQLGSFYFGEFKLLFPFVKKLPDTAAAKIKAPLNPFDHVGVERVETDETLF